MHHLLHTHTQHMHNTCTTLTQSLISCIMILFTLLSTFSMFFTFVFKFLYLCFQTNLNLIKFVFRFVLVYLYLFFVIYFCRCLAIPLEVKNLWLTLHHHQFQKNTAFVWSLQQREIQDSTGLSDLLQHFSGSSHCGGADCLVWHLGIHLYP